MPPIKQYVNLDPSSSRQLDGLDRARAGKTVILEAKIRPGKSGVPVAFDITNGASNLTLPGHVTRLIATTNDEGKATMSFDLSENGGDEFTVKASLAQDRKKEELSSDTYVVWRRLYYQMSRFEAGTPGEGQPEGSLPEVLAYDISPVRAELAARQHNIELVDKTTTELIKRHANVLTEEGDSRSYKKSAKDSYDRALEPVVLRVVVANQMATPATEELTRVDIPNSASVAIGFPCNLWTDRSKAKEADWLVAGEWRFSGETTWLPIPSKWITKVAANRASINLDAAELGASGMWCWRAEPDRTRRIDLRITYRCAKTSTNGESWFNAIWLASSIMNVGPRGAEEMKQTAIHEIGHFISMVPITQETHYLMCGHQGNHCRQGLSPEQVRTLNYRGLSGTCIMFGENAPSRLPRFCADCDPSMRKSTVKRNGMPKSW